MNRTSKNPPSSALDAESDARLRAVFERDARARDEFVYGVVTTGIYCRPSCPARLPRRENISFWETARDAEGAGYRACKRCRPNRPAVVRPELDALRRFLDSTRAVPTLDEMAEQVGLSPFHLHREFKKAFGMTPRSYVAARRKRTMVAGLDSARTVTAVLHEAGFGSSSRFYESAQKDLGMSPTRYRGGGASEEIRFAVAACSLGAILVAATTRGVCAVSLGDDPTKLVHELERRFSKAVLVGQDQAFEELVARVVGFVERPGSVGDLPLDLRGTVFQERVWRELRRIPSGTTKSYAELARDIGRPRSSRAIGAACAANTVAVLVPCHRVVRTDGDVSGYRWGVERKRALLERERREKRPERSPA